MFKLLIGLILITFFGVLIYCGYKIIDSADKGVKSDHTHDDVDTIIDQLKCKIRDLELSAVSGMEHAEAKLQAYRDQLKKAELVKQKHNI